MKKTLLVNLFMLIALAGFSQASKTQMGLGFHEGALTFVSAQPTTAVVAIADGKMTITTDSLHRYDPAAYKLNDGTALDSINFGATGEAYIEVWAMATEPVTLRIDFANTQKPGCLCPSDRSANLGGKATTALTTTMTRYLVGPIVIWTEAYNPAPNEAKNGPVDNMAINQLNIFAIPPVATDEIFKGTITIDSIFFSDAPIISVGVNKSNIATASTKLFPNPVSDVATLTYIMNEGSDVKLVLNDMTGRTIRTISEGYKRAGVVSENISVSDLEQGIYNISFIVDGAVAKMERLIVK